MRGSRRQRTKYPLATLAFYGPDNTRATKMVASILRRPGRAEPTEMRSWTTNAGDVRNDRAIAAELTEWLHDQRITSTISSDRIIGCPHEEGVDYPMGRACAACSFWEGIDRFTHERIAAPVATMSPEKVLIALGEDRTTHPLEALESADAHRAVLVPPLLQVLEHCLDDPDRTSDEDTQRFCYALYLMAKWRETRAYPLVIRWVSLPVDTSARLSGDVSTEDGDRILAAVYDGDLAPIQRVVLNREVDEISRGIAVGALALLSAWGEVPRETIVEYFAWLAREGLEREPGYVWDALAAESAEIEALSIFPALRQAYDEELIDESIVERSELDEAETAPPGSLLEDLKERRPPIDDVAEATSWWARFSNDASSKRAEELARMAASGAFDDARRVETDRAAVKVGRNDPCPCGSGKKYKKCCGATIH